MKLSTIFANAADFHLFSEAEFKESGTTFSCIAIKRAVNNLHISREDKRTLRETAVKFAVNVSEQHNNTVWFNSAFAKDRQSERYIWLKFLSLYAKDQGV